MTNPHEPGELPALAPGCYLAMHPLMTRPVIVEPPADLAAFWRENGAHLSRDPRLYGWTLTPLPLVVELPAYRPSPSDAMGAGYNWALRDCREALAKAGIRVKP